MSQQNDDYPFQLVEEDMFKMCTEAWHKALKEEKPLNQYFNCGNQPQAWLNYVYFNVSDILYLLSSVGTQYINLRFALVPTSANGGVKFSVILYGTNEAGEKTSSYFRAAIPSAGAPLSTDNGQMSTASLMVDSSAPEPAAYPLVAAWITNWNSIINNLSAAAGAESISSQQVAPSPVEIPTSIFDSVYGPLKGYSYPLKDLLLAVAPLLNAGDTSTQFRFVFGMHHYLKPGNTDMENFDKLFGMVIHINGAGDAIMLNNNSTYEDISEPCPPYCH